MKTSIRWMGWVVVLMLSVGSQPVRANEPPVIGPLAEVMMYSGVGRVVVPLVITDAETPVGMLSVQVRTSNGTIIPVGGASVAFQHGAWELSLDPTGGRTGVTTATVSVTDPEGAQATGTLRVQVVDSVSRLAVSPIPAQRVWQGGPDVYVGFTAGDGTGVDPKLTVTSSVPDVWRNGGVTRSGVVPGGWLLRLVPSADRSGSGWITVTANWGTVQTSTSFLLVVQPPLLTPSSDSTIASLKANTSIVAADFDRDGIQELAVTRKTDTNGPAAIRFLRQKGDAWIEFGPIIPGSYGELECPDFDGDGRVDLATLTNERLAVWRNRPTADGGFAFEPQTLPWGPTWSASRVLWGDFDCDGRVDALLVCSDLLRLLSWSPSGWTYRVVANSDFNGLWRLVAAADADGDGDLDLLSSRTSSLTVSLWRNDGRGGFTLGTSPIFRASGGNAYVRDVGWADVDGDGVPEPWVLQGSFSIYDSVVVVLKRGFASYSEAGRFATAARMGRHLFWADLDGDGRLDVAQLTGGYYDPRAEAGLNQVPLGLQVLKGNGEGDFDEATALVMPALATNLTAVVSASSGRLDLLTGARWLRNRSTAVNTAPTVPTGLRVLTGTRLRFQWQAAADFNQPGGLTYNVRVGTSPGADDVVASRSLPDGIRLVPEAGNAGGNLFLELDASRLPKGPLFWSVQAVDASFLGGPFAVEQSASVDPSNGDALVGLQVAVSRTAGGLWQLTLKGTVAPAVAVVVEASEDLVEWVPFWWIRPDIDGTFTAAKYYTEEGWAHVRFYRARSAGTAAEP